MKNAILKSRPAPINNAGNECLKIFMLSRFAPKNLANIEVPFDYYRLKAKLSRPRHFAYVNISAYQFPCETVPLDGMLSGTYSRVSEYTPRVTLITSPDGYLRVHGRRPCSLSFLLFLWVHQRFVAMLPWYRTGLLINYRALSTFS